MAPSYIQIGRELSLRLALVRRTLAELTLNDSTRSTANALVDSQQKEIDLLVSQMQSGQMPSNRRVLAVPENLKAARQKLYETIGPAESALLDEMLASLRGEARATLGKLRLMLENLHAPQSEEQNWENILAQADADAENLPKRDLHGDEYDRQRAIMNQLLVHTHDQLETILTPQQLTQLGPRFEQLAADRPSTAPSPRS
jgi:hypothetical protein